MGSNNIGRVLVWILFLSVFYFETGKSVPSPERFQYKNELEDKLREKRDISSLLPGLYTEGDEQGLLSRERRGLGSWLKKVLHISKPKTTTTTTKAPAIRSTTPGDEDDDDDSDPHLNRRHKKGQDKKNSKSERVSYVSDQYGDSEIDWLLPKSLRRSTIMAKQGKEPVPNPEDKSQDGPKTKKEDSQHRYAFLDSFDEGEIEPIMTHHGKEQPIRRPKPIRTTKPPRHQQKTRPSSDDVDSKEKSGESSQEQWKHIFESFNRQNASKGTLAKIVRRKRGAISMNKLLPPHLPQTPIKSPQQQLPAPDPIETGSKEELHLLHELLIHIVNGKCPKPLDTFFTDDLELNLFHIIDSSPAIESTQSETSPEVTTLIHQLVNCSISSESQKDALEAFLYQQDQFHSPSHYVEVGAPVSRSKRRGTTQMKFKPSKNKQGDLSSSSTSDQLAIISNFELPLIAFVSEQCKQEVSLLLLKSASQLILDLIPQSLLKPVVAPISEEMLTENLNILQFCAQLILKHQEKEKRQRRKLQEALEKHFN